MGCVVFDAAIPTNIDDGIKGPGFPVEVYNVLGAGDAFMSGFLRGYLRQEPIATCCAFANACGAFAVSRLLCSAEYATWAELQHFLEQGASSRALRHDASLNALHWATTRDARSPVSAHPDSIMAFAIDHRIQLEAMAEEAGTPRERICDLKLLAVEAANRIAAGRPGFGMLIDGTYGRKALFRASELPFWIGRPVEWPGSRPLDFEGGGSLAAKLVEWPIDHTIKCLCFMHPDDPTDLRDRQERELLRLQDAARLIGRELLVEIIAGKHGTLGGDTVARVQSPASTASASDPTGGSSKANRRRPAVDRHRRHRPRERSALPRHHAARPRRPPRGAVGKRSVRLRTATSSKASRWAGRSSPNRLAPGSKGRSLTPRWWTAWRNASALSSRAGPGCAPLTDRDHKQTRENPWARFA